MPNILCFGDSNTFGTNPSGGRWPRDVRWPGALQRRLGLEYYVVEEGLGGRTTVMEDTLELDKNGRRHLPVALRSHRPLDLVIIMLGTNDMKHRFSLLPADIAKGAEELGTLVERYPYGPAYSVPRVMLISPILIGKDIERSPYTGFTAQAIETSKLLAPLYRDVCKARGWLYLDAAHYASPSERDSLHMEAEGHLALSRAVESIIQNAFSTCADTCEMACPLDDERLKSISIAELKLPNRVYNALRRAHCLTVYDVVTAGPRNIRSTKYMGPQTFNHVINALANSGVDISEWLKWIGQKPFPLL